VGPRTGLDDMEKRKFLPLPALELRPLGRPARRRYTDPQIRDAYRPLVRRPERKGNLKDLGVGRKKILKFILKNK
jgi:hypothetical protein